MLKYLQILRLVSLIIQLLKSSFPEAKDGVSYFLRNKKGNLGKIRLIWCVVYFLKESICSLFMLIKLKSVCGCVKSWLFENIFQRPPHVRRVSSVKQFREQLIN